ncbi:hypothetical protein AMEX_G8151 [Astyanax mexicanus]|uniref:FXYD domain-containing ion transport regulator n=1 Tax=Astyanax mexicanus TaxID=7994 RepID=A0A8T2LUG2_ASTMX|nr:hypothetical protein AMEX_G8151 [Astyanax mexicanus]
MSSSEESAWDDQSAFNYDYETLRTTGVILAVVMFVAGILIALTQVQWNALQRQKYLHRRYRGVYLPWRHLDKLMYSRLLLRMWRRAARDCPLLFIPDSFCLNLRSYPVRIVCFQNVLVYLFFTS